VFKGLLGDRGYTVVEAASGPEGLERATAERPRAIFLDLNMPGMDGAEVLGRLKADPRTRDIPVIIHTSRPEEEASELLAAGAAAVLSKERASRSAALDLVREALEKAGVRRKE
jgi:CheY-like chemotaxis protein